MSQPDVESVKGLGNLFLAAGIVFSGLPYSKFEQFTWLLNIKCFSDNTFYRIRERFYRPRYQKNVA